MYDLLIVGGGPAGIAAGIYAARKRLKTVLVTDSFGGQSLVSDNVQNWIGEVSISGFELAGKFERHLRAQEGITVKDSDRVMKIEPAPAGFAAVTEKGDRIETKTVLITSGSRRRRLEVPGEKEFEGKGVFYCSICDAPLMKNVRAAVVGGGNAGLEAVIDLIPYASEITLLHRNPELKGDPVTQEQVKNNPKVKIILNAEIEKIEGGKTVTAIAYKEKTTGEAHLLPVEGVFVEIGAVPNSDFVGDLVVKNDRGEIVVDHKTQRASRLGIWAAGDVSDVLYKQNNISAGDAVKAVLNIYAYLCSNA